MSTAGGWVQQEMPSTTHLTKVTVLEGVRWRGHVTLQPAERTSSCQGPGRSCFYDLWEVRSVAREIDGALWRTYYVPKRTYYVPRRPYAQPYHPREEEAQQEYLLCQGSKISTPNYPTFNIPTFPPSLQAVQQPLQ